VKPVTDEARDGKAVTGETATDNALFLRASVKADICVADVMPELKHETTRARAGRESGVTTDSGTFAVQSAQVNFRIATKVSSGTVSRMLAVIAIALLPSNPASAILSERHLTGVHPFACDGEWDDQKPAVADFRLVVLGKESRIRLEKAGAAEAVFPYQIVDGALRFRMPLSAAEAADCRLELPAGSLSCGRGEGARAGKFIGLCLPES
jgi:hypothetical protein